MTANSEKTETAAVAPAAEEKRKGVQVSTTVPAEYFDGLEDHRWSKRINKPSDLVRAALDDYVAKHGIAVDGTAPKA